MKLRGIYISSILLLATVQASADINIAAKTLDDKTITGTLTKLENNQLFIGKDKLPLEDVVELVPSNSPVKTVNEKPGTATNNPGGKGTYTPTGPTRKLTGKVIGTDGSWGDEGNTRDMAFDGDMETFFDAPTDHADDGWVGLDLESPKVISRIKYSPRKGNNFPERMLHGKFQGSMNADFSGKVVTLFEVTDAPNEGELTSQAVKDATPVRYVRYLAPAKSNGNVSEIEFWGKNTDFKPEVIPAATTKTTKKTAPGPKAAPVAANAAEQEKTAVIDAATSAVERAKAAAGAAVDAASAASDAKAKAIAAVSTATAPTTKPATSKPAESVAAKSPATKPAATGSTWSLIFANGDKLSAAMTEWDEKKIHVNHNSAKDVGIDFPIESLTELWKGNADQIKLAKAVVLAAGPEDAAFVFKEKEVVAVRGIAMGITGEFLRFKLGDEEKKINLSKLVGVMLLGNTPPKNSALQQTIEFTDGNVLTGVWKSFDPAQNTFLVEVGSNSKMKIAAASIARIRTTNGRLVYLEELKPASVEETPYFDRLLTYKVNKSLTGGPIKLADTNTYTRGISVHSRCVLSYEINGSYDEFKSILGFQIPEGKLGQAAVRVLGDGKVLYDNPNARGDAKPAEISVKVAGVSKLVLEVDFGANEDTGDRVVWANPRLIRQKK